MSHYDPGEIEGKWQREWETAAIYKTPTSPEPEKKRYILDMFPYPSAAGLHVGHVEQQAATDTYSRYLRMTGHDVLHPMGWDAFGLPAENYAVKTGIHPDETTQEAIENFRRQIKGLGTCYDWERELSTNDPAYYRWTQWLFLKLFEKGLAYKKKAPVNWCPKDQTVLANEQVVNGECERCGSLVEKKEMTQWFFKITAYAERLLNDLDGLDWPESTKEAQRNWIGKSEGAEITFPLTIKKHFVFMHGRGASPQHNFWPWLKGKLEALGHTVEVPELPGAHTPNVPEQAQYVLKHCRIDENTVLVGHSFGSAVALKVAEAQTAPVAGLITIGGFIDPEFKDEAREHVFDWQFDFDKIKTNAPERLVLQPEEDYAISREQTERLAAALTVEPIYFESVESHAKAAEEPMLARYVVPGITVFTTRPDTLYGATYMVIAPEHSLLKHYQKQITNYPEVEAYVAKAVVKSDIERQAEGKTKTGVKLSGIEATNPATGEVIPIFVADYVLGTYGTGAIMAVPAHDERDNEFAKVFNIPVKVVVDCSSCGAADQICTCAGVLINSNEHTGLDSTVAKRSITEAVGGRLVTTYRLRDWLISRQRYWGVPIPVAYDTAGKAKAVPDQNLPWELPRDVEFKPTGYAPLADSEELKARTTELFGADFTPEVDTMDTFVDSSWYFLRYCDPNNANNFAAKAELEKWLPVDLYVGGAEHTVLHLLYSRFITKFLYDEGLLSIQEPFQSLRHQGLILGPDGNKMSKSKGNVINPDLMIERFGADTLRMYEMFMGPFDQMKPWSTDSMVGVRRFLEKVWRVVQDNLKTDANESSEDFKRELEVAVKKVGEDTETFAFNTAISQLMICVNAALKATQVAKTDLEKLLLILAPYAPHIAEELWHQLGHTDSVHLEAWPEVEEAWLTKTEITLPVQIDGKVRAQLIVNAEAEEGEVLAAAQELPEIKRWLEAKTIAKALYIKGRIVSFVTKKGE